MVAGIDIGGTKILGHAMAVDDPGRPLASARRATPRGGPALVAAVAEVVGDLGAALGGAGGDGPSLEAVGVGAAGLVDLDGVLRFAPNLAGVEELDIATLLAAQVAVPVVVSNDATCAMAAEHRVGGARHARDAVLVTLGTGIGAGVVARGELVRGAAGFAGE